MANQINSKPLLNKPAAFFTSDIYNYRKATRYVIKDSSPWFWENENLIVFVQKGSGTVTVNSVITAIAERTLCFLRTYNIFRFISDKDNPLELEIVIFPCHEFARMFFTPIGHEETPYFYYIPTANLDHENWEEALGLLESYKKESECPDSFSSPIRQCLLSSMNHLFIKHNTYWKNPDNYDPPLCHQILVFISLYCHSDLKQEDAADRFGITVRKLNETLRSVCRNDFREVLNRARVDHAYTGMFQEGRSNWSIAQHAGFQNEKSFYRIFQAYRGESPEKYCAKIKRVLYGNENQCIEDRSIDIEHYIITNCRWEITIESCAKELFIPKNKINPILQSKFGKEVTFHSYLIRTRLRYAKGLLGASDLPIYDVAINSGFNSVHTFIRVFKQYMNCTPKEYRRTIQTTGKFETA